MRAVVVGFGIPAALILAVVAAALLLGLVMQRRQDTRAAREAQRQRTLADEVWTERRPGESLGDWLQRHVRPATTAAPGLEQIPLCPDCRVVVGGADRVPCQWHADIASVAIERHADA